MKQKLIFPSFQGQADSTNKGRVLGYQWPLPQVLRTASHHGSCWCHVCTASSDFGRLAGFGRGGQGVKLVFSSFKKEKKKRKYYFKNNNSAA